VVTRRTPAAPCPGAKKAQADDSTPTIGTFRALTARKVQIVGAMSRTCTFSRPARATRKPALRRELGDQPSTPHRALAVVTPRPPPGREKAQADDPPPTIGTFRALTARKVQIVRGDVEGLHVFRGPPPRDPQAGATA